MGVDSCSKVCEFESQHRLLDGHFAHLFVVWILMFVWKYKNKRKRGQVWPIFKKVNETVKSQNSQIWPSTHHQKELLSKPMPKVDLYFGVISMPQLLFGYCFWLKNPQMFNHNWKTVLTYLLYCLYRIGMTHSLHVRLLRLP